MGVPGIFANIIKKYGKNNTSKYPKIIIKSNSDEIIKINELYFDANCLFHPKCQEIAKNYNHLIGINNNLLENKMVKNITDYIDYIIDYIDPSTLVYIAIDGVAPMAKIKHQRLRRFKSIRDNQIIENIAKKHKKEINKFWNSNCITPGTIFMKKIFIAINDYIKKKKLERPHLKFIFSSSNIPGEGEHKIMNYIHNHNNKENTTFCVYGLDADLIFLSLATNVSNLYLLREIQHMETGTPIITDKPQFNFVNISSYREVVISSMIEDNNITKEESDSLICDYIFICYLLGNDFIPNLPSTNLRNMKDTINGLEIILKNYRLVLRKNGKSNIIDKMSDNKYRINRQFFVQLLEYLSEEEEIYFKKEKKHISKCESSDPYEIELHNLNNLQFKINDPIRITDNFIEAKKRYYIHYFGDIDINFICYEYIKALYWILYYYYDKYNNQSDNTSAPDWLWYYPWHHAPFVSDLYNYIKNMDDIEWNKMIEMYPKKNTYYGIITPLTQLLLVLPQASSYLLPKEYKNIILSDNLKKYYPKIFEQDLLFKNKFWQAIPNIPILEYCTIRNYIISIQLTNDEFNRNKHYKLLIY